MANLLKRLSKEHSEIKKADLFKENDYEIT